MSIEQNLLFAVLAFENDLLDLSQLTAACRAWAEDKSKSLAELLVQRGWITLADCDFLDKLVERKLAKHHHDPRVTLNSIARGDVCDAIMDVEDSDIQHSVSSWPATGSDLIETIGETQTESQQPKSRYTWLNEVGRGGLGRVWLARDNDMSREVALKEIRLDKSAESQQSVRRLIKEAQITGQLQHPNIVPVYELHRGRRPFYTMKLVRGETLAKAIQRFHEPGRDSQREPLSLPQLLNVFVSVCEALAYSHSRGIIHRDLKPENIILGDYGEVVVLDWGLAKHIGSKDESVAPIIFTDDAQGAATHLGATPGTPAYMAPEQASGRIDLIDHRTDVYGLGAILFEILTGRSPHRDLVSRSRVPPQTKRQVGEEDTAAESSASAPADDSHSQRNADSLAAILHRIANAETPRAQSVKSRIPVELDAICATAMSKRRDDRYQDAKALIADVKRFLFDEPVSVIPAPLSAQTRRWAKRHQMAVTATAAALIIGLASLGTLSLLMTGKNKLLADANSRLQTTNTTLEQTSQREREATILAEANSQQAEKNAAEAKVQKQRAEENSLRAEKNAAEAKVSAAEAKANATKAEASAAEAKANAATAEQNEAIARANANEARQQSQIALTTLESVIFDIQRGLKNVPGAGEVQRKLLTKALQGLEQISERFVSRSALDRDTAAVLIDLGDLFLKIGNNSPPSGHSESGSGERETLEGTVATANKLYSQALKINQAIAAANPNEVRALRDLSVSYNKLGSTLLQSGQADLAVEHYQNGLRIIQKLAIGDPSNPQIQRDLSISQNQLGDGLLRCGNPVDALASYRKGLEVTQKLALNAPDDAEIQYDLCVSCLRLGSALLQFGQAAEARVQYQKGLEISLKLADGNPNDVQVQRQLSLAYNNLGDSQSQLGQPEVALEQYQKGREISEKLAAADSSDVQAQRHLAISFSRLGDVSLKSEKFNEALGHYQKFQAISQKLAANDPSDSRAQRDLWASYNNLGSVLLKTDKLTEALKYFQQGMEISQKLADVESSDTQAKRDLSVSWNYLGDALLRTGKAAEAVRQYQQGLEIRQILAEAKPSDTQAQLDLVVSFSKLGDVTQQLKEYTEAIAWYEKALEVLSRLDNENRLPPFNKKNWIPNFNKMIAQCRKAMTN